MEYAAGFGALSDFLEAGLELSMMLGKESGHDAETD